jgi:hypothetical protein
VKLRSGEGGIGYPASLEYDILVLLPCKVPTECDIRDDRLVVQ